MSDSNAPQEALLGALRLHHTIVRGRLWLAAAGALGLSLIVALQLRLLNHAPVIYIVEPNGRAGVAPQTYGSGTAPTNVEALYVAQHFVELLMGWNSSTVHADATALINLCGPALAQEMRRDLADTQFVDTIRNKNVRSEVLFGQKKIGAEGRGYFRVHVQGTVHIYSLSHYDAGRPLEKRDFDITLTLTPVPRDPELRPNGLVVAQLLRGGAS